VRDGHGGEEVIMADPGQVESVKNTWRNAIRNPQRFNDLLNGYRQRTGKDPLPADQIRALQAEIAKRAEENVSEDRKKLEKMQDAEKGLAASGNDKFVGYVTLLPGGNSQATLYRA
jgi:predicted phage gp36 major capsid-like protein